MKLRKMARESPPKLKKGLRKAGNFLLRESRKITPIDTGDLRRSGRVRIVNENPAWPELVVEYTMPYAIYVHEDPFAFHPVGQWKFLEQPAREYRHHMIYMVAEEFK